MFLVSLLLHALSYEEPVEYVVLKDGDECSRFYRIPAIIRAKDGSLITSTDKRWETQADLPSKIDVVIKRSTDDGKTWSPQTTIAISKGNLGYGDASLVMDKNSGTIFCFFNGENGFIASNPDNPQRLFFCKSEDNGVTWTEKTEITQHIYSHVCDECKGQSRYDWYGMFMASGNALQLSNGRIIIGVTVRITPFGSFRNYAIFTDDLGKTWDISNEIFQPGDECKIVQQNNGALIMSIRHKPHRIFVYSYDNGKTWKDIVPKSEIVDPACNGDFIRYTSIVDGHDKNRLLHSIPYHPSNRQNITVLISYDEGETWPVMKTIHAGAGSYSSIAILENGDIIVYYEKDHDNTCDLVCSIFSLEWLSDGQDRYQPPVNA